MSNGSPNNMTNSGKQQSSSWGSFLQQAVAGVEARLDNILAEDEDNPERETPEGAPGKVSRPRDLPPKGVPKQQPSPAISRTPSTNSSRANDRLKQRLQKAVTTKPTPKSVQRHATPELVSPPSSEPPGLQNNQLDPEPQTDLQTQAQTEPQTKAQTECQTEEDSREKPPEEEREPPASPRRVDVDSRNGSAEPHPDPSPPVADADRTKTETPAQPDDQETPESEAADPAIENPATIATASVPKAELDRVTSVLNAREQQVSKLASQLREALSSLDVAKKKAVTLESTRNKGVGRIRELEDTVASLQVEKRLATDQAKTQIFELREQAEKAAQLVSKVERESKAEITVMESRLEAVRARAEEVTSGPQADSEAKLLRQLETLQTQYASASENWQGIETTLLSRISNLEAERDDAIRRESEMRKKARDAAVRVKRQEEELEETRMSSPNVDRLHSQHKTLVAKLTKRAEAAESALAEAKAAARSRADKDAKKEKQEKDVKDERNEGNSQRITEPHRRAWLDGLPQTFRGTGSHPDPDSPQLSVPSRTMSFDHLGASSSLPARGREFHSLSGNGDLSPGLGGQISGRPSPLHYTNPVAMLAGGNMNSASSASPLPTSSTFGDPDTLGTPLGDKGGTIDLVECVASPLQAVHDVGSVSTVAAGPSVQLVERMSAAIRRLESEKVAAREELSRISSQRDEARGEIVALMKETEAGRTSSQKVTELEKEVEEINSRYQTTLELLGEKSELVEELRADVEDVKSMYRDLVERTVQ